MTIPKTTISTAPFWWSWPSWQVEGIAGLGLQLGLHAWGDHSWWLTLLVGTVISVVYERWLDRHGWAWRDVLQRVPGQLVGELVWAAARGIGLV